MMICNSLTETVASETSLWLIADKVPSAGTSHLFYFVSFFVCVCVCGSKFSQEYVIYIWGP